MTLFVQLQEAIISFLFDLQRRNKDQLQLFTKGVLSKYHESVRVQEVIDLMKFNGFGGYGLTLLKEDWARKELLGILEEQIDESGSEIRITNILGSKLYYQGKPVSFEEFIKERNSAGRRLRTDRLAQPGALKEGDILATGDRVLFEPREGGNGSVLLKLTGGFHGHWISVPDRIPIALLKSGDKVPEGYIED